MRNAVSENWKGRSESMTCDKVEEKLMNENDNESENQGQIENVNESKSESEHRNEIEKIVIR